MTEVAVAPRFDMGRVVNRTFGVIGRNWLLFGLLALVLAALPQVALGWFQEQTRTAMTQPSDVSRLLLPSLALIVGGLVYMVSVFVLQAALVHGVIVDLNGRKATLGDCLATGFRFFLPILAISLLLGVALMFGFILLIVPGVLMILAWMVVIPVEVVEKTGVFGAFKRSANLTRNHRGALFGLMVAYLLLSWICAGALIVASGGLQAYATIGVRSWGGILANALIQSVQMLLGSAGTAVIYYELRSIKEGIGPEALASVFD